MKSRRQKRVCFISIALVFVFALAVPLAATSDEKKYPGVRAHWQARIKPGKTRMAIEAGSELIEYFNAKFRPVSHRAYIEKSDEGDILHISPEFAIAVQMALGSA